MLRVVIVDDEELAKSGLRLVLGADVDVLSPAQDAEPVEVGGELPRVVLLDVRMPERADDRLACARLATLTPRERDVLRLIGAGLSNRAIGTELYLSLGSVKDHVSAILAKLKVQTRLQAALVAERAGLPFDDAIER